MSRDALIVISFFILLGAMFLPFLIAYICSCLQERKEHKEYIEKRNHHEHEQMQASQEAMQESMLHLAKAVKALEKMVRVSHGLPDATEIKPKKKAERKG